MVIKKFEEPKERKLFKFLSKIDYVKAKNYYRSVCWEIRRLEDMMLLNVDDDYKKAVRKNLNYLKSQRKAALNYIN